MSGPDEDVHIPPSRDYRAIPEEVPAMPDATMPAPARQAPAVPPAAMPPSARTGLDEPRSAAGSRSVLWLVGTIVLVVVVAIVLWVVLGNRVA